MYDYNCGRCGGLVPEPMKPYGYSGRFCHCAEPMPPKQVSVVTTTTTTQPNKPHIESVDVEKLGITHYVHVLKPGEWDYDVYEPKKATETLAQKLNEIIEYLNKQV